MKCAPELSGLPSGPGTGAAVGLSVREIQSEGALPEVSVLVVPGEDADHVGEHLALQRCRGAVDRWRRLARPTCASRSAMNNIAARFPPIPCWKITIGIPIGRHGDRARVREPRSGAASVANSWPSGSGLKRVTLREGTPATGCVAGTPRLLERCAVVRQATLNDVFSASPSGSTARRGCR